MDEEAKRHCAKSIIMLLNVKELKDKHTMLVAEEMQALWMEILMKAPDEIVQDVRHFWVARDYVQAEINKRFP